MKSLRTVAPLLAAGVAGLFLGQTNVLAAPPADNDLAQQIFDTMISVHGVQPETRPVHAKGIVCQGTFTATADAAGLSKAAHFQGAATPVTVRLSDGSSDPTIPDNSPGAGPRGMAIRFSLPGGANTDIVAMSHNGFVVSSGEDFLALQKSIVATDPSKPHPWPVEAFLGAHPAALKFVQENAILPVSFANEAFFSNDSFTFINKDGTKQVGRYQIIPVAGRKDLSADEGKTKSPEFLFDGLKTALASGPIQYHFIVQLPNAGDATNDPSIVWPDDRKTIDAGTISITAVAPDSDAVQKKLAFDPTTLTDGIELSDDPFPALRSSVYALSATRRHAD